MSSFVVIAIPLCGLVAWSSDGAEGSGAGAMWKKPPNLTFKVDDEIAKKSHAVSDFIDAQHINFVNPKEFPVLQADAKECKMVISAAENSNEVERKSDGTRGYIVAQIENPNNCQAPKFPLKPGEKAVWIVRYDNKKVPKKQHDNGHLKKNLKGGASRVVILDKQNGDRWLNGPNGKKAWSLGYCDHKPTSITRPTAMLLYERDVCTYLDSHPEENHNPDAIAAEQSKNISDYWVAVKRGAKRAELAKLLLDPDPSLWFACGTDCCYGTLEIK